MWVSVLLTAALLQTEPSATVQVPPELDRAPYYSESDWLDDSLRTTDLVVVGTPRRPEPAQYGPAKTSHFDIERILFGSVDRDLHEGGTTVRITAPYRFRWDASGVYVFLRTTQGYFSMNPSTQPLTLEAWSELEPHVVRSPPEPDRPLYEKKTETQIYHYYTTSHPHGTNVYLMSGEVFSELHDEGDRVLGRSWDRQGCLGRVDRIDDIGNGYSLDYRGGQLSHFAHYRSEKRHGVERKFDSDGRAREEIYWREGLRHGPSREWAEDGALTDVVYEDGFIAPVIRFRGATPGGFRIHKSEFGITYAGPISLIRLFEVGMPVSTVSEILRVDFSERTGLHFPVYTIDTYLYVAFENGGIIAINSGWNGIDYEFRR